MTTIYSQRILSMMCLTQSDGLNDVVYKVNWSLVGQDDVNTSEQVMITELPAPSGAFTPYSELTESQVMVWVNEYTTTQQMDEAKSNIDANLLMIANTVTPALPWA